MTGTSLLLLGAALASGEGAVAVLPIRTTDTRLAEQTPIFVAALTEALAGQDMGRIISADEVNTLLETEAARQGLGGAGEEALVEAAAALGAGQAVTGQLARDGEVWTWEAGLVAIPEGGVTHSGRITGRGPQALLAQVPELALQLAGRMSTHILTGPDEARRLGFHNAGDLDAFRAFREKRPAITTTEALTEYVREHNVENPRLAWLETALFGLSGVALAATCGGVYGVLGMAALTLSYPLLGLLGLGAGCGACVSSLSGCALLGGGLTAVGLDGLNRGRVSVRRTPHVLAEELADEERRPGSRDAAAWGLLLSGPATCLGVTALPAILGTAVAVTNMALPYAAPAAPNASLSGVLIMLSYLLLIPAGAIFLATLPVLLGGSLLSGLLLLFWPSPPLLEAPAPAPTEDP